MTLTIYLTLSPHSVLLTATIRDASLVATSTAVK